MDGSKCLIFLNPKVKGHSINNNKWLVSKMQPNQKMLSGTSPHGMTHNGQQPHDILDPMIIKSLSVFSGTIINDLCPIRNMGISEYPLVNCP